METLWKRLEAWIDRHANLMLDDLNEAATEEAFTPIEKAMGVELEEGFKAFYRIRNGQFEESEEGIFDSEVLLSLEAIIKVWQKWRSQFDEGAFWDYESEPEDGIRSEWWNPYWLPLTASATGSHFFMDFAPTREGTMGQIIRMEYDSPKRQLVAGSFKEWIGKYVDALESGRYIYSEEWGGIVAKTKVNDFEGGDIIMDTQDSLDGFEMVNED